LVYLVQEPDENEASSPRRLTVSALELQTGKPLWQYETENLMFPLFASDKVIYLLSDIMEQRGDSASLKRNVLYALESKTGKLLWKYEAKNAFDLWGWLGLPIVVQDSVIYGMHALNAKTGAQLWTARTRNFRPVQISSGILYGYDGRGDAFSALKASSGELLWSFKPSPESRFFSHALADGILYLGSEDHLYALDAKTGSPIWSYEADVGVMAICVYEGALYMLTSDGAISAFDLKKAATKLQPSPR
jgi:outer membrane protein assembly factor BamB